MPNWTEAQQHAISIRDTNTLVSAAAGSGKTAVLVERVLMLLTDEQHPVSVDRLLVATFTNAAAAEMRERIHSAIVARLEKDCHNAHLRRQLLLLGQAQITTVHSFCQHMLRNYFHLLGLSGDFEVGDMVQIAQWRSEALEELLEEQYQDPDPALDALMEQFGGKRDDKTLGEIILKLYDFAQSTPSPQGWLDGAVARYQLPQGEDANAWFTQQWGTELLQVARMKLFGVAASYDEMIAAAETGGITKYLQALEAEQQLVLACARMGEPGWDDMVHALAGVVFGRLPAKDKEADRGAAEQVKAVRDQVKKTMAELQSLFPCTGMEGAAELSSLAPVVQALCGLVSRFGEGFAAKKREGNVLDFNDLEHFMIRLLEEEDTAAELRGRFDHVLVDEYQDTNGVQAAIFERIANGTNLFMVGDVKQSIYGFRNAQPQHFLEKYNRYAPQWHQDGTKILLSHNFRSNPAVLDFANHVFERVMSEEVGDCTYGGGERLQWGGNVATQVDQAVEVHAINTKVEGPLEEESYDAISREALFTAQRIVELVEVERPLIFDRKIEAHRPVEYRDIVILARGIKTNAVVFGEQLALCGVPVYAEQTGSYFASVEIAVMLSMLRVIDNPLQDVPLIGVLRSPMVLLSEAELAEIRCIQAGTPFYDVLRQSDNPKAVAFLQRLEEYRNLAQYERVEVLIRNILHDTAYDAFVGALPNGAERMGNLRLLCQRAGIFEQKGARGLYAFIRYMDSMVETGQEYTTAKAVGENDNAVTILSIHKSKGLEFPVVFLVRCASRFNLIDLSAPVLYDLDLGVGPDCVQLSRHIKYPSVAKLAIGCKRKAQMLSEEMRLLYVALTRPREKLVIVGSVTDGAKSVAEWQATPPRPDVVAGMNSFFKWIGLAVADTNMIQVHQAESMLGKGRETVQRMPQGEQRGDAVCDVAERLEYEYPYGAAAMVPAKLSVSELTVQTGRERRLHSIRLQPLSDGALTPATRGTLIHFVLQNLDLTKVATAGEIAHQVQTMVERGMIDPNHRCVVEEEVLVRFFQSNLGRRMCASTDVRREFKFFVEIPAGQLLVHVPAEAAQELVLLQGVIDCCFVEGDEFVILDFKTGRNREEYQLQLDLYALCLEKATGKRVKETHLYPLI